MHNNHSLQINQIQSVIKNFNYHGHIDTIKSLFKECRVNNTMDLEAELSGGGDLINVLAEKIAQDIFNWYGTNEQFNENRYFCSKCHSIAYTFIIYYSINNFKMYDIIYNSEWNIIYNTNYHVNNAYEILHGMY
jgi:hypothetical protein